MHQLSTVHAHTRISPYIIAVLVVVLMFIANEIAQAQVRAQNDKHGSSRASKRLMKELQRVYDSDSYKNGVFTVEIVDDSIYEWNVKIYKLDPESYLHRDFVKWKKMAAGRDHILLRVSYDNEYPFTPPYVRIVHPYIFGLKILSTGEICLDLLTNSGWTSAYTIEPLILQISALISNCGIGLGKEASRLAYAESNKIEYEKLMKQRHGW
uniref:Ubiquitin-conjugating enzyme E2 Q2 n=1 Tax=Aceria tosichella TaxID=561515 RepID=A0A6G1S5J0_9ACAR